MLREVIPHCNDTHQSVHNAQQDIDHAGAPVLPAGNAPEEGSADEHDDAFPDVDDECEHCKHELGDHEVAEDAEEFGLLESGVVGDGGRQTAEHFLSYY